MQLQRVVAAVGDITRIYSFTLLVPLVFALIYDPRDAVFLGVNMPWNVIVFGVLFLLLTVFWLGIRFANRSVDLDELQDREAYLTVGIGWLLLTVFSALPFLGSGHILSPVDAFFESMSGLTTTGATILTAHEIDTMAPSLMIWRTEMQYIGGMGIIVLSIALLARLTQGGIQLLQAETPGPSVTRIRPKLAQTAKTLWLVYAVITGIFFVFFTAILLAKGFSVKDAIFEGVVHMFTTISTGGFNNHGTSIAFFDSVAVETLMVIAMLVGGTNFTLLYYLGHGDWKRLVKDTEWRFFMTTVVLVSLAATGMLWRAGHSLFGAMRESVFTVASISTSSGFSTGDFASWPDAAQILLLILMLTGATAGSTSGGLKHVRILLLLKIVVRQLRKLLHPRAVIPVRLGGRTIKEETLMTLVAFFFAYLTIAMGGAILVTALDPNVSLVEGIAGAISMAGNTGPTLGAFGPTGGFAHLAWYSKVIFAFIMWFGRLEVFAALLIFNPSAWRN